MPLGSSETQGEGGVGPYKLARAPAAAQQDGARLRRDLPAHRASCACCAPLYAKHVAHTTPSANHITDRSRSAARRGTSSRPTGIPTGPTWTGKFFLGADSNGRDVAVRLLYGGRNSLEIGFIATFISVLLATIIALVAGYFRGVVDGRPLADDGPDLGLSR